MSWIRTKKAVDEAEWKANSADNGWDDFILPINLKPAYVHFSDVGSWLLSNIGWSECHLGGLLLLLPCSWSGRDCALFIEGGKLQRPACGIQGRRKLLNEELVRKSFLLCTCQKKRVFSALGRWQTWIQLQFFLADVRVINHQVLWSSWEGTPSKHYLNSIWNIRMLPKDTYNNCYLCEYTRRYSFLLSI